jgi:hypothetical protein
MSIVFRQRECVCSGYIDIALILSVTFVQNKVCVYLSVLFKGSKGIIFSCKVLQEIFRCS